MQCVLLYTAHFAKCSRSSGYSARGKICICTVHAQNILQNSKSTKLICLSEHIRTSFLKLNYKNVECMHLTDWASQPRKIPGCKSQQGEHRRSLSLPSSPSRRPPCHSPMTSLKPAWKGLPWQVAVERPVTARLALKSSRSLSPMGKIFLLLSLSLSLTHTPVRVS